MVPHLLRSRHENAGHESFRSGAQHERHPGTQCCGRNGQRDAESHRNRPIVPAKRTMTAAQAIAGLEGRLTPSQGDSWLKVSRGVFDEPVYISAISVGELTFWPGIVPRPSCAHAAQAIPAQPGAATRSGSFFSDRVRLRHAGRLHETIGQAPENVGQRSLDCRSGN